jgi:hypothetical protein
MEGYRHFKEIDDDNWFVVVTNYDEGEDPIWDDRLHPAIKRMEAIG